MLVHRLHGFVLLVIPVADGSELELRPILILAKPYVEEGSPEGEATNQAVLALVPKALRAVCNGLQILPQLHDVGMDFEAGFLHTRAGVSPHFRYFPATKEGNEGRLKLGIPNRHPRRALEHDHAAPLIQPPNRRFQRLFEQVTGRGGVHDEGAEYLEVRVGQQRAQGFGAVNMVIFVPPGDAGDRKRAPQFYDSTFQLLTEVGIPEV